jgi:phosphoribosyl-ATP pyrophosphohydrolase
MKTQKVLLKTAYCLAGVLILVSIGFNIFQYQRNKRLSEKPVPEKIAKNESTSDSISNSESAPVKIVQKSERKSTVPISKEEKSITSEIDELEYHLNAAEEELDMTSEQLSDELSQKAKYKKAYDKGQKIIKSNPAFQKSIRDSVTQTILKNYDPLFEKLNISEEEFDEFKGMLVDQQIEIRNISASIVGASSYEEEEKARRQGEEIRNKYENKISEFLGRENNEIYQAYASRLTERRSLRDFMETFPPDNRMNEEQTEVLIDSMYEARRTVYDKMGPVTNNGSSFELTEETLAQVMERSARVDEKYVELCRGMMTPEQVEQYKTFLKQELEMQESLLKLSLY